MNPILSALLCFVFFSAPAHACTDFSGTYKKVDGSRYEMVQYGCEMIVYKNLNTRKDGSKYHVVEMRKESKVGPVIFMSELTADHFTTQVTMPPTQVGGYDDSRQYVEKTVGRSRMLYLISKLDRQKNFVTERWLCGEKAVPFSTVTRSPECKRSNQIQTDIRI